MQNSIVLHIFIICQLIFVVETSTLHQPGCGRQNKESLFLNDRIIGGTPTEYMEFPWIVSIQYSPNFKAPKHGCTGSIIYPKFILTAAHCFHGWNNTVITESTYVATGVGNLEQAREKYRWHHKIQKYLEHPHYIKKGYYMLNDIALLKLVYTINLGPSSPFQPICLPTLKDKYYSNVIGAGWGCTKCDNEIEQPTSLVLNKTIIPRIDNETCKKMIKKAAPYYFISDEEIKNALRGVYCVYDKIKNGCKGDSGGPGMCIHTKTKVFYVCGIASFKLPIRNYFGIYTNVIKYMKWITKTIIQSGKKQNE